LSFVAGYLALVIFLSWCYFLFGLVIFYANLPCNVAGLISYLLGTIYNYL